MISRYTTPDYDDGELDDMLNYSQYGKCMYKTKVTWDSGVERMDRILFDESEHQKELGRVLNLVLMLIRQLSLPSQV